MKRYCQKLCVIVLSPRDLGEDLPHRRFRQHPSLLFTSKMRGAAVGVGVRVAVAVCLLATSVGVAIAAGGGAGNKGVSMSGNSSNTSCPTAKPGIKVVSVRWHEVGVYFTITTFVIIAGFAKLVFHHLHWLSNKVPESCVLVLLGNGTGSYSLLHHQEPAKPSKPV
ncbi:hypothetical protein O3P69_013051 [Scylla paramamosain]|uniref:Uncharacterized protein n=1 Tax=Scylla paramamosain TaxID=85552 RepID=A0AAW0TRL2_SCYPA